MKKFKDTGISDAEKLQLQTQLDKHEDLETLSWLAQSPAGQVIVKRYRERITRSIRNMLKYSNENNESAIAYIKELSVIEDALSQIREIQRAPSSLETSTKILDEALGGM